MRLPRLRVWISANLLPTGTDRELDVASLASALTAYATDVAQELALAPSGRVDVRVLESVPDVVEVQGIRPAPVFRTALMPRRMDSADAAPPDATTAVFEVAAAPEGVVAVASGQVLGRVAGPGVVVLASARVSGRHAGVQIERGIVTITDVGSLNGTYVGSERLTPNAGRPLAVGGTLRLGDVEMRLQELR
jgi:hypothetical protein